MSRRKITDDQVREARDNGWTLRRTAETYNVSEGVISMRERNLGYPLRENKMPDPLSRRRITDEQVRQTRDAGWTLRRTAETYNVSEAAVSIRESNLGYPPRENRGPDPQLEVAKEMLLLGKSPSSVARRTGYSAVHINRLAHLLEDTEGYRIAWSNFGRPKKKKI